MFVVPSLGVLDQLVAELERRSDLIVLGSDTALPKIV
jgi:hypothetical protein